MAKSEQIADILDLDGTVISATPPYALGVTRCGAVTQLVSKSTAVEINALCGTITTTADSIGSTIELFRVNNRFVAATDVVVACFKTVPASGFDALIVQVNEVGNGYFDLHLFDFGANGGAVALLINFVVIKGVAA